MRTRSRSSTEEQNALVLWFDLLDADVVAWLKQAGPGYQTRANQILREKMLNELPR